MFSRINDSWRHYKSYIKKNHFEKYSTLKERLKNRPGTIPKAHFRQLMTYWRSSNIQEISKKNVMNRAKLKYLHQTGPTSFAIIRARLREKKNEGEEVTQAEMFIETRKARPKGKEVDEETQVAIEKLKDSIEDSTSSAEQTFKLLLGKEKSGRVRCFGRIVTPSQLKRKEEISTLKKEHANELNNWARRFEGLEVLLRCFMQQNNPNLDDEALDDMITNAVANENNNVAMRSSTSTNVANLEKVGDQEDHAQEDHDQDLMED